VKLGEALTKTGLISSDELRTALELQKKTHDRLGEIVVQEGFISSDELAPALADHLDIPFVNMKRSFRDIKAEVISLVPRHLANRFKILPLTLNEKTLTVALCDPLNLLAIDTLRIKTGLRIKCVVAGENDILEAIEYCYNNQLQMREHIEDFIKAEQENSVDDVKELTVEQFSADDQPVVQYVKSLLIQAVNKRASDIHLQPKQDKAEVSFRIDGVLYKIDPPPKSMITAINTRIKILSSLDIAEKRLPQDGRFKINIGKKEVDVRTSCFPTIYGESVVMRILDTSAPLLGLEQLGFSNEDLVKYRKLLRRAYGLILVTGPTGAGKTTTLYTSLNEIKSDEKNIVTLEDPVEYRLPFIQQSQVNKFIGFDFPRGLRSIIRQDPDVIMVGEIRDKETAEIAIHAALTGHLVFSTLHTNDSAGAAVRLLNMGVEPFLITSSLLGVVAQRLVRTICHKCRESFDVDKKIMKDLSINSGTHQLSHGKGCPECMESGYWGRMGIFELMVVNDKIRQHILKQKSSEVLRSEAKRSGMTTLRDIGISLLKQGITTPEEVLRITQETEET